MPSIKRLKSVTHSVAHHAVSGLSYVHPHLGLACFQDGIYEVSIDLANSNPCPEKWVNIEPLRLSLIALKSKFYEIANSEGFEPDHIVACELHFKFNTAVPNEWCCEGHAKLTNVSGKVFSASVDFLGNSIVDT